ncbi:MAG TPA: malto-oligosyltrehalose trehalohydrolase [Steroidobacteraceae bacterium]|jgi:maltooligosyltrehalose trehalohydrolase
MATNAEAATASQGPGTGDDVLGAMRLDGATLFRVWAPTKFHVDVLVQRLGSPDLIIPLHPEGNGYFSRRDADPPIGALYKYRVDGRGPFPDPCSRYQPEGPHGPSLLVDSGGFHWTDATWQGARFERQVLYELHIGTFTQAGTFDAARERLAHLHDLGITAIELLPIAECPGRRNWGYDGVQLFAPYHQYGEYDAFKRFVDAAHGLGIAVILDVVYNHVGPDGNYLSEFCRDYFSETHRTEWGPALNFDGRNNRGTRELVINNACYWVREFHVDGFRLDAIQSIFDDSAVHVLAELVARAREVAGRPIFVTAEDERQHGDRLQPMAQGGFDLDGIWNDDFHHSARVALIGSRDGYFCDYTGRAAELAAALQRGFLFQGQHYYWQKQRRGRPVPRGRRHSLVHFLQNHDQVANTGLGDRAHVLASPARYRALTALLLLGPQTPLLFMGQEFLASSRFTFFADHQPELAKQVHAGRREFLKQFRSYRDPEVQAAVQDPACLETFLASKLNWSDLDQHHEALALHRDLLRLRRNDPVLSDPVHSNFEAAALSEHALVLRWFAEEHGDRLVVVNLQVELPLQPVAEPLLAPPLDAEWTMCWNSESFGYGGRGAVCPVTADQRWRLPAECAVLFTAGRSGTEELRHA